MSDEYSVLEDVNHFRRVDPDNCGNCMFAWISECSGYWRCKFTNREYNKTQYFPSGWVCDAHDREVKP